MKIVKMISGVMICLPVIPTVIALRTVCGFVCSLIFNIVNILIRYLIFSKLSVWRLNWQD